MSSDKIKQVAVFGATGSIGDNSVRIIRSNPDSFKLKAITGFSNYKKLIEIAREFLPEFVCIAEEKYFSLVRDALIDLDIQIFAGATGLIEIAKIDYDISIAAITGLAGLNSLLTLIPHSRILAIANKEAIVCAGEIILAEALKHKVKIIPLDSEHNSLFQILEGTEKSTISKITLTASGGPFLRYDQSAMKDVTIQAALNHPNWKMGDKICVDSASMVNKALEMIEAHFLFQISEEKIEIVIHPESLIHAFVSYIDGGIKAFIGNCDMRIPISYALSYPKRLPQPELSLELSKISSLNFLEPDLLKFRALVLARNILKNPGIMQIVFNAANEFLVAEFLAGNIKFTKIIEIIEETMSKFSNVAIENLDHVFAIDQEARSVSKSLI